MTIYSNSLGPLEKKFKCAALAAALICASHAFGQETQESSYQNRELPDNKMWSARVYYESRDDIQRLSRLIDHMNIDENKKTIAVEVATRGVRTLRKMGFKVEIDETRSLEIQKFLHQDKTNEDPPENAPLETRSSSSLGSMKPGSLSSMGRQHATAPFEKTFIDIEDLAKKYPDLVHVAPVGQTWVQTQLLSFRNLLIKYLPKTITSLN